MTEPRRLHPSAAATGRDLMVSGLVAGGCLAAWAAGVRAPASLAVLGAIGLLFVGFGLHALCRRRRVIEVCDHAIGLAGRPSSRIRWAALSRLALAYYATRRDGENGWMRLRLEDAEGRRLSLDSDLDGFAQLVARAAGAPERRGVPLSPTTQANLAAVLGTRNR